MTEPLDEPAMRCFPNKQFQEQLDRIEEKLDQVLAATALLRFTADCKLICSCPKND